MNAGIKPKHQVLQEFTNVLHRRNPMNLDPSNPLEYEAEALSMLSRFTEAALHLPDDEAAVVQVATAIVGQTLEFWFEDAPKVNHERIARELIAVYRTGFGGELGPTEQAANEEIKKVISVTVGG